MSLNLFQCNFGARVFHGCLIGGEGYHISIGTVDTVIKQ